MLQENQLLVHNFRMKWREIVGTIILNSDKIFQIMVLKTRLGTF